jgi:hypothetical protein
VIRAACLSLVFASFSAAATCAGGNSLGEFRFTVISPDGAGSRPVRNINRLLPGYHLRFDALEKKLPEDARVALMLVPAGKDSSELTVLDPKPVRGGAEWDIPERCSAVALVYGPNGLSVKKLKSLGEHNPQLMAQLADYAQQSAKVEALVDALAQSERGEKTLDAALTGFSSRYGVAMPKLDLQSSTDEQAAVLLRALLPTMSSYDPLSSSRASVMQQSAGLATSVAAMFWGNPVGLAAGGAALFQNLRTILFPATEFRSAFAQGGTDALSLCAKAQPARSRMRQAYLWAHRVPDAEAPTLSLLNDYHVPLGAKSKLSLTGRGLPLAGRLSGWRLGGQPVPVTVEGDALTIDLTFARIPPGRAALAAEWDWDPAPIAGNLFVHEAEDLGKARVTHGLLVEGGGPATLRLEGPDFQFLERVTLDGKDAAFRLPNGSRGGEQRSIEVEIDATTLRRGSHALKLLQAGGAPGEIALTVLPPHPVLTNLPVRVNLGQAKQRLLLRGSGLDRMQAVSVPGAAVELLAGSDNERAAEIRLENAGPRGSVLPASLSVVDVPDPLPVEKFASVAGPRPIVDSVRKTVNSPVALQSGEVVAGSAVSFSLSTRHVPAPPAVELYCREGDERSKLLLRPGDRSAVARLELAGEGLLFLSLDPGAVGHPGCELAAVLETAEGRSDPVALGRVTRVPAVASFVLTDEKSGEGAFAGILTGTDLETIEKTGWDAEHGLPVAGLPSLSAADPRKQTLKVALPWPSPAPHAPLFVWLRGESRGRATGVKY